MSRRQFLGGGLSAGLLASCATTMPGDVAPKSGKRVVVIGGGWGGATAAKYVRLADPGIEVILFEPNRTFVSCPFSNFVLSGVRPIESLTFGYDGLRRHGVRVRHEMVTAIDAPARRVRIGDGYVEYDRLVVSPGVDFQWEQVDGLPEARDTVPTPTSCRRPASSGPRGARTRTSSTARRTGW